MAKVRGNKNANNKFSAELLPPEFEAKLKQATCESYGKFGDYIISKIKTILQISNRNTFGGSPKTHKVVDHIYAMTRYFWPASIFYAIAPDIINKTNSFRLTQQIEIIV